MRTPITRRLCIIAHRAMKTIRGYFAGYISKRQQVGRFELRSSVKTLPLLKQKSQGMALKHSSAYLAHASNRMLTSLERKGALRMAPEEFMLAIIIQMA